MNERIKQLAIEAKLIAPEANGFDQTNLSKAHQKFAQLIVRECIVDYYRRYLDICSDEDITVQVERYVKEYFGIGE